MKHYSIYLILIISACSKPQDSFVLQGHRGARGIMPENTIPSFIYAIDQQVNTIELDLAVTKDEQLLVSHDPYMTASICLTPDGNEIPDSLQKSYNIYEMNYEEVSQFDCGSKVNKGFPDQKKFSVSRPLLTEVIDSVENYLSDHQITPVAYNIEIKSSQKTDGVFHPSPDKFSDLTYQVINEKLDWARVNIQSFDFRILQYFHKTYTKVTLAVLIGNELDLQANLDSLGFVPEIYSCHYSLVSQELVNRCHQQNMKIIPWTINEPEEMKKLMAFGIDGLITDYPNKFNEIVRKE